MYVILEVPNAHTKFTIGAMTMISLFLGHAFVDRQAHDSRQLSLPPSSRRWAAMLALPSLRQYCEAQASALQGRLGVAASRREPEAGFHRMVFQPWCRLRWLQQTLVDPNSLARLEVKRQITADRPAEHPLGQTAVLRFASASRPTKRRTYVAAHLPASSALTTYA